MRKEANVMLIRFSVENCFSFLERATFSMIPGLGRLKKEHINARKHGVSTLKTAIAFGANASGKSNLVKAIALGRQMILFGSLNGPKVSFSPYRLSKDASNRNTRLEYEIQAGRKNYAYGFVFNEEKIVEEWLYEITNKDEKMLFERFDTNTYDIAPLLNKNTKTEHKQFLQFVAKATPENQLLLREMIVRRVKENVEDIKDILAVYNWFEQSLKVLLPNEKYKDGISTELVTNEQLHVIFEQLLSYFGTGIDGIELQEVDVKSLNVPLPLLEQIQNDLSAMRNARVILQTPDNTFFFSKEKGVLQIQKFMTKHKISGTDGYEFFDTKDESDGTNKIIDFVPVLIDLLRGNNVFVIDEMERSLHPNLIYDTFDIYLRSVTNVQSQLIVTTHESSLLTQKLVRKDEVWFITKDEKGTQLHSLEEYNVRFDKEIRKDYLLGRYKAIPRLGDRDEALACIKLNMK